MSILSHLDPTFLRRVAAALVGRRDEYADIFLEQSLQAELVRDEEGEGPASFGATEGCAARLFNGERVRHHAMSGLDPKGVATLPGMLRGSRAALPPLPGARQGRAASASFADAEGVAQYLEEVEAAALRETAALPRASRPVAFRGRAEIRSQSIAVATSEGEVSEDQRDWIVFSAHLVADGGPRDTEANGWSGAGASEGGGAKDLEGLRAVHPPAEVAGRLVRSLLERRDAIPAPSGETTVVLAPGLGGILFHEACGHALEGDRALKGRSALVELLGEQVGHQELTLVDDPTLAGLPGSRRLDDEGWPAARNVLIDSGRVVGLLLDRATALLAGTAPTGSARRESYRDLPLPRMTNTFIVQGTCDAEEILASVPRGVYVAELGAGEVDTVTADFSFRVRRGYVVAGGRIIAPLEPCQVSGNGIEVLRGIKMIGVDLRFDPGAGECGKEGQRARAAVGQPTLKVEGLAVHPLASNGRLVRAIR